MFVCLNSLIIGINLNVYEELDVISMKIGLVDYDIEWDLFSTAIVFHDLIMTSSGICFRRQSYFTILL